MRYRVRVHDVDEVHIGESKDGEPTRAAVEPDEQSTDLCSRKIRAKRRLYRSLECW